MTDYFRAVLESTADGILVVDEHGKVVTSNQRFAKMWGIPDDVLAEKSDDKLLAYVLEQLVDPERFLSRVRELYRSSQEELDMLHFKDGRVFERSSAPLVRSGEIAGRVWSFRDVSAEHHAKAALHESEARFRSIYNYTPVMMHSIDANFCIVDVNDYWLQRMGYRREEVLGRPKTDFLPPEAQRRAVEELIPALLERGWLFDVHHQLVTKDGEVFECLMSAMAHFDEQHQFVRSFAWAVDVSERKRAERERLELEEQMRRVQKLESLGVLAGGIAHDFNNLLVSILGNADLALGQIPPRGAGRELVEDIVQAGQRAAGLCQQLLAYSGSGKFKVQPVDVAEVVRDMTHLLEVSLPKSVALRHDFEANLPAVEADVNQLRQVVMNLITNAGEAIGETSGEIAISVRAEQCSREDLASTMFAKEVEPGSYVCLEVSDTGVGMDRATLQRIFEPFFSSKATGRGLGLAATLGIVRGHGGTLSVHSAPHEGATFRILLPASSRPAAALGARPAGEVPAGRGELVLIVDDEEGVRSVARRMLEGAGLCVVVAASGEEALVRSDEHGTAIAVALIDLTMPGMGGEKTVRALRARQPDLGVVLTSGYDAEAAMHRLQGPALPDGFVQKPYRRADLVRAVREVLDLRARRGRA